ncbi:MAG: hypothetical protein PWP70_448 [Moorella sp. (in: firmicutes)]|nr:hypothetical protein [Moorella sp. (in: firmicutes)]
MSISKIYKTLEPLLFLVPKAGVEPARYCYHWILSPARLPVPPLRRIVF